MHKQLKPLIIFQGISNLDENWWTENHIPVKLANYTKVYCFEYPQFNKLWKLISRRIPLIEKSGQNLIIFHSFGLIPFGRKIRLFNLINHLVNFFFFKHLAGINPTNYDIITFTPELSLLKDLLTNTRIFYYVTDDYDTLPWWTGHSALKQLEYLEKTLIPLVIKIIVVSDNLKRKYESYSKPIIVYPTPVDVFKLCDKKMRSHPLPYPHPIIGYSGSIHEWKVNVRLLIRIIKELPKCSFVFTGTVKIQNRVLRYKLFSLRNFHHLGTLSVIKLHQVMSQFDVCLIPYQSNRWSQSAYPVKIMEYLSLGKPVITTKLPSVKYLGDNNLIYWSKNENDFINNILLALKEPNIRLQIKRRVKEAKKNDWNSRIIDLIKIIND